MQKHKQKDKRKNNIFHVKRKNFMLFMAVFLMMTLVIYMQGFVCYAEEAVVPLIDHAWTESVSFYKNQEKQFSFNVNNNYFVRIRSGEEAVKVTLYDSEGKICSGPVELSYDNSYSATFAVKKGNYYISVISTNDYNGSVYYEKNRVRDFSGHKIKKALYIKHKKEYIGLMKYDEPYKRKDYYKFKVNKNKRLKIRFYGEITNGAFEFKLYDTKKKEMPSNNYQVENGEVLNITSSAALPKGTYYISVKRTERQSCGCYSIKLNYR